MFFLHRCLHKIQTASEEFMRRRPKTRPQNKGRLAAPTLRGKLGLRKVGGFTGLASTLAPLLIEVPPFQIGVTAHSSSLFHADFCLMSFTFPGLDLYSKGKAFAGNVASFPRITCGSTLCTSGLSQMKATCVMQDRVFPRAILCMGSVSPAAILFFDTKIFPFPPPWYRHIDVSSRLVVKDVLPTGMWLEQ